MGGCESGNVKDGVCAALSVKQNSSQLGNVGKFTPVQCLTSQMIKTSLHVHEHVSPISEQQSKTFQTSLFQNNNNNNNTIQINLEHKLKQRQTKNTLLQHIFQGCLVVMVSTVTTTAPFLPSSNLCVLENCFGGEVVK